jgi:exosortase D (VPLPA-CTERM-specific)
MTLERSPAVVESTPTAPPYMGVPRFELGFAWLLISIAGLSMYFRDGIYSLFDAWAKPEYSHGFLIPVIAGYLILREIKNTPPSQAKGSEAPGLLIALLGLGVGLLGNLTQIPYFITYGLLITAGGVILLMAGARRGLKFWAAWAYLLFMLPLPNAAYWQVSTKLQFISSALGVEVIRFMQIPVLLEGNVIDLGEFKLQVAEACSGLRYLFPLASFGFLFAVLYQGPFWHRALLFISSIPITVLMNSFRIGVIGILVNSFGIDQAEGFLHWFEGWIIFVSCMAILFGEAWLLQRFTKQPKSVLGMLDLDSSGFLQPARNILSISGSGFRVAFAILSVFVGVSWILMPKPHPTVPDHKLFALFPLEVNGWSGEAGRNPKEVEDVLAADDYLTIFYHSPDKKHTINLFSAFYRSTTDGTGIHSPEICIPGGGWEVSRWQRYDVVFDSPDQTPLKVNRAVIQKGTERQLVYYWFHMRGQSFASEYQAKLSTVWDSMTKQRADGALVRFITPLLQGESDADGDRRLAAFMPAALKQLPEYIPD